MKTFIIEYQNLESRIDPSPYHPIRQDRIVKLQNSGLQLKPLKDVVEYRREIVTEKINNAPYLGLENIVSDTGEYVQDGEGKQEFGSAFRFYKGDVLFPKLRPYLNKVHLAKFDGYSSTEIHVLKAKEIDNYYLWAFLISDIVVNQTSFLMTGNTLPRLQTDDVNNLLIPIPANAQQKEVRDIMQSAYQKKQELEQEAEALLYSVDSQIEKALSITVSEEERNELQMKLSSSGGIYSGVSPFSTFITALEDISKKSKLDPFNYLRKYKTNKKILNRLKVDLLPLSELVDTPIKRGRTPQYTEEGIGVIKVGSIHSGLITKVNEYVSETDFEDNPAKVSKDNIAIASTGQGSIGKVAIVEDAKKYVADNHISIVSVDANKAESRYIYHFLRTIFGKLQIEEFITGSTGQTELYPDDIKEILIPLPTRDIQQKVVAEIDAALSKRKKKINDAESTIEQAKAQVEEIILGKT